MSPKLRAWWWQRSGLDGCLAGMSPREALLRSGWSRSVGGASPYLGIFSRTGASRAEIDRALASVDICELPTARGCTYVLPREDYPLGLSVAALAGDAELAMAKKFLGVTDAEIEQLCAAVIQAVSAGPLDPAEIKAAVGDKARGLGEAGKKRGTGNTLPIALGRLQVQGHIRRVPADGRLDRQRYRYVAWRPSPLEGYARTPEETRTDLAARFWRWAGPASLAHFQKFAGVGVKAAAAATAPLALQPIERGGALLLAQEDVAAYDAYEPPSEPRYGLVGSLDGVLLHRGDLAALLDPIDQGRETATREGTVPIAPQQELYANAILDRGRLVGLWEYDPFEKRLISVSFVGRPPALADAIERMEAFVRDQLEDCRSFSLDAPESRRPKLENLRAMAARE